ncbi:MAG: CDP-glycerol glycerophosphotransferase family protein, partial [Clostridium sp.]|nr:CDP-glycerol glycerophosphotransferase family protein [Clostridium sp.]
YEDYISYVPGPVVQNTEELVEVLKENNFSLERVKVFKKQSFAYLDGKSTERLIKGIFEA